MEKGKISIVLPTYNGSKYIRQSIESCLNQTYKNFELIIVDDCSKDNTPQVIKSYNDPRIRYIRNEKNQRLPKSLNVGFNQAVGEYLTWTSDDNLYTPTALQEMIDTLQSSNYDFVYADIYKFHDDRINEAVHEKLPTYKTLKTNNCVRACFLYTRKVLETVGGYDPDMELLEDYDYWVRISKNFYMHHLERPLYYYRLHGQSLWGSRLGEIRVAEFLFKLKFDTSNIQETNYMLKDFIITRKKGPYLWNKILVYLNFSKKLEDFLRAYKTGQMSFTQTRMGIYHTIKNYLA
jgi:glycosyltransferase involved in cell wall biosynthesis